MARVNLNRSGMRRFALTSDIESIVKEQARIVQRVARRIAPVETGAYRNGISVSTDRHPSRVAAHVTSGVPYAGVVEARYKVLRRAVGLVAGTK